MEPQCGRSTWAETTEAIRARSSLTERARVEACRRVRQDGETVARVAAQLGVGWTTAMAAVRDYGTPRIEVSGPDVGVSAVGFVTGVVDLTGGSARLLDLVEGRSGKALCDWVSRRDASWRDGVSPSRRWTRSEATRRHCARAFHELPGVLEAFHVTRLGFAALDEVRRRVQQQSTGHRSRHDDPLYAIRRVLRRRADRLTPPGWDRLLSGLAVGDLEEQIGHAWIAAQDLCLLYRRDQQRTDRSHQCLDQSENQRVGHGYRNFDNYCLRVLLYCGTDWHTSPVTRIRGRLSRLAA